MKKMLFSLSLLGSLGLVASASAADLAPMAPPPAPLPFLAPLNFFGLTPPVIVQLGPTTAYSTINCANFAKVDATTWKALDPVEFSLGFTMHIVPPPLPIKKAAFIYNNVDLYSQLEAQCGYGVVRARY